MSGKSPNSEPGSAGKEFVHPLFDERSHYRTATALSVWSDGGHASIRDIFDRWHWELATHLRRRTFEHDQAGKPLDKSQKVQEVPRHPAWSDKLNRAMAESFEFDVSGPLVRPATDALIGGRPGRRRDIRPIDVVGPLEAGPEALVMKAGAADEEEPVLWATVLGSEAGNELPAPKVELLRDSATGAVITGLTKKGTPRPDGEQVPPPFGPVSHHFEVSISLGAQNQNGVDYGLPGHRVMFLLLRSSLVNRLQFLMDLKLNEDEFPPTGVRPPRFGRPESPVRNLTDVQFVLFNVLDPKNLLPEEQDGPRRRRARWLQATLALAPGLEAILPEDGPLRFRETVDLGHDLATLRTREELKEIELLEMFYDDEDEDDFEFVDSDGVPIQEEYGAVTDAAQELFSEGNTSEGRTEDKELETAPSFFVPLVILGPRP